MPLWIPMEEDTRGFSQIGIAKALSHGLTFRSLADTATATLAFNKTLPTTRKWRAGLPADKEAGILKNWHERKRDSTTQPSGS